MNYSVMYDLLDAVFFLAGAVCYLYCVTLRIKVKKRTEDYYKRLGVGFMAAIVCTALLMISLIAESFHMQYYPWS